MRDAMGSGYDIPKGIKLMEPSDIQKYSICSLQLRPVRVRVSEVYGGSGPVEAKNRAGLHLPIALRLQMQLNGPGIGHDPP
jgi:hypothetical protein